MEPLRFSLRKKEIEVIMEDDAGEELKMVLREMDGDERDAYLNGLKDRMTVKGDTARIKNFAGHQVALIKRCLFYAGVDGAAVEESKIKKFPSSVQSDLFEAAHTLCGLDTKKDDDEKEE
jgi:hypothetical protein